MERLTISMEDALAREFDALIKAKGYENRSEAVRDMLRRELEAYRLSADAAPTCVGVVSYVYDHHERVLGQRMIARAHAHHDLVVSTLHAHLDHDNCIEASIVAGATDRVRRFANGLIAESGVRHGSLNLVPVKSGAKAHKHEHHHPLT